MVRLRCFARFRPARRLLGPEFFKQGDLFNIDLELSKAEHLASRNVQVSHTMTFTGVDLVDGKPMKGKVENSWGDKIGDKGYFIDILGLTSMSMK